MPPRTAGGFPDRARAVETEGHGAGAYRLGSFAALAARRHGAWPAAALLRLAFPKKKLLGALRSALASKFADGKLVVVKAFDLKEPKTKPFREALDKLKIEGTTLLVDISVAENKNLELSSRNIDGLELVKANEVHPYHLMRYTHVVFAQPALEKLQDALKKSTSRRSHETEPAEDEKKPGRRLRKTKTKAQPEVA